MMQPSTPSALGHIGMLQITLASEGADGWLRMDGSTEYARSEYPFFIEKFGGQAGIVLAGSTAAKFKLPDIRNRVLAIAGGDYTLLQAFGQKQVVLGANQVPAHSHKYDKAKKGTSGNAVSLGINLISVPTSIAYDSVDTGSAGAAQPAPVSVEQPSVAFYAFVYAGRRKVS